jgi:hypothetical protein
MGRILMRMFSFRFSLTNIKEFRFPKNLTIYLVACL